MLKAYSLASVKLNGLRVRVNLLMAYCILIILPTILPRRALQREIAQTQKLCASGPAPASAPEQGPALLHLFSTPRCPSPLRRRCLCPSPHSPPPLRHSQLGVHGSALFGVTSQPLGDAGVARDTVLGVHIIEPFDEPSERPLGSAAADIDFEDPEGLGRQNMGDRESLAIKPGECGVETGVGRSGSVDGAIEVPPAEEAVVPNAENHAA
ncbi:hypothetical protein BDK51DRAFT_27518 [Blyttiomyces helicus]|uniref:Uncharacterized protein n=1 Tax=Blyttiomyces helicus TaxID=388810 RepID=A0A4P9WTE9_9FUNG|nr:hypothetical protein BDK51DRAFT_27518 [Blyttiomyces helicus]|eukprot:RKO94336.1 hypothetical protein BDK51DRAFT_27518 [Blyttiomyces helicus]